jgi:hypothetical protein
VQQVLRADATWMLVSSAALTVFHYAAVRPFAHPFLDDPAIILKYLDNFAQGCFFCWNPHEPPVFGISAFVYGVLTGALAWLHVPPEMSLISVDVAGTFFFYVFAWLIFRRTFASPRAATASVVALCAAAMYARETFMIGMETPLHLAIVFAAIYAFLARSRALDAACALAVVSKLDAGPLTVLLIGLSFLREPREGWPARLRRVLTGYVLPVAVWALAATVIFGSPLPQSYRAKQFYRPQGTSGFFPYLGFLVWHDPHPWSVIVLLVLAMLAIVFAVVQRRLSPAAVLALSSVAAIGPYYLYSPSELPEWYFTLPEMLLISMGIAFPAAMAGMSPAAPARRPVLVAASFLVLVILATRTVASERVVRQYDVYSRAVEADRLAAGRLLREKTPPDAVVYAGHGHIARESQRRVVDLSGLNSRFATDHHLDTPSMFAELPPGAESNHGLLPVDAQIRYHLGLEGSFYNVTHWNSSAFRVFVAEPGTPLVATVVEKQNVRDGEMVLLGRTVCLRGENITLGFEAEEGVRRIVFGVTRETSPRTIALHGRGAQGPPVAATCQVPESHDCAGLCTVECVLDGADLPPLRRIWVSSTDNDPVLMLDPVLLRDAASVAGAQASAGSRSSGVALGR